MRLKGCVACRVFYNVMTLNMVIHSSEYSVIFMFTSLFYFFEDCAELIKISAFSKI